MPSARLLARPSGAILALALLGSPQLASAQPPPGPAPPGSQPAAAPPGAYDYPPPGAYQYSPEAPPEPPPEELDYEEDEPIPAGYHLATKPRTALKIVGGSLFIVGTGTLIGVVIHQNVEASKPPCPECGDDVDATPVALGVLGVAAGITGGILFLVSLADKKYLKLGPPSPTASAGREAGSRRIGVVPILAPASFAAGLGVGGRF